MAKPFEPAGATLAPNAFFVLVRDPANFQSRYPTVTVGGVFTGALDNSTSRQVLDLLRALVDEHGQTIVMVTHDPVAAAVADRVLMLADGRFAGELTEVDASAIAARMTTLESTC